MSIHVRHQPPCALKMLRLVLIRTTRFRTGEGTERLWFVIEADCKSLKLYDHVPHESDTLYDLCGAVCMYEIN